MCLFMHQHPKIKIVFQLRLAENIADIDVEKTLVLAFFFFFLTLYNSSFGKSDIVLKQSFDHLSPFFSFVSLSRVLPEKNSRQI